MDRRVKERLVGATILVVLIVLIVPELLSGPKARVTPPTPPSAAGPAEEAVRNVTVDLSTSKATPVEDAMASAAAPSAQSIPAGAAGPGGAAPGDAPPGNASPGNAPPGNLPPADAAVPGQPLAGESGPWDAPGGAPAATSGVTRAAARPTISTLRAQQPAHAAQPELESEPSAPKSTARTSKSGNANESAAAGAPNHHWAVQLGSFASRANAEKLVRQLKPHNSSLYVSPSGRAGSSRYRVRIGPLADRDAAERVMAKLKKEGRSASLVAP